MVWFFTRKGQYLRLEARRLPDSSGCELVITHPDGSETVECFDDSSELSTRRKALEGELVTDGWAGPHGRLI